MVTKKKRGLGKGIDALLGSHDRRELLGTDVSRANLQSLAVDLIQCGRYQPRLDMQAERLQELADSIKSQGVVQPIVVRPLAAGRYEIIAGERRWRATQMAGLHEIPAVVRDVPDQVAMCLGLIENIQRENLNPIEEARALERLLQEFEMTHEAVAEAVGRSRAAVTNLLRLLELQPEVRELVEQGQLDMGHARALLGLKGKQQAELARQVVRRDLSVRATELLVRNSQNPKKSETSAKKRPDADIQRLERDLSERLGARVELHQSGKGKGQLRIHYATLDALEGILEHIK